MSTTATRLVPLAAIAPETWDAVGPDAGRSPMSLRLWVDCAAAAYGVAHSAKALVVGDPAAPRAVLPLVRRPGLVGWHTFAGNEGGGVSVAAADDDAMAALARGLLRFGHPVNLGHIPTDSRLRHHLEKGRPGLAVVVSKPLSRPLWPFIELDPGWSDPARYLRASMTTSIRRRARQLNALGDVRMEFLAPDEASVDAALDKAFHIEAMGWKHAAGIALAADHRQAAFYRAYGRALARLGRLHVTFLGLDDTPLAMSIGEVHGGTYWAYKTGFDPGYRKYAPGILMQHNLIAHCAELGLTRFDFQGHQDDFKRSWTDKAIAATSLRIYPLTPRGVAAMLHDAATHGIGRLRGKAQGRPRRAGPDRPGPDVPGPDLPGAGGDAVP
jgi:hypothetical protein